MDTAQKSNILRISILTYVIASSLPAAAGEWKFTPRLFLEETYSDNIKLSLDDIESGFVHQGGIELDSTYTSRLFSFNFKSRNSYNAYSHDSDANNDFVELDANGSLALWTNGPKIVASSSIQNIARNEASNGVADLISGNTVEVRRNRLGLEYAVANSRYNFNSNISYSDVQSADGIGERTATSIGINTNSGMAARNVIWRISGQMIDSENQNFNGKRHIIDGLIGYYTGFKIYPFVRVFDEDASGNIVGLTQPTFSSYGPGFRWQASSHFSLDVSYNFVEDESQNDDYPAVSVNWQPSQRTSLAASFSQRFFGDSYQVNFSHRTRKLTNSFSYNESLQAFDREYYEQVNLGTFYCPVGDVADISECVVASETPDADTEYQLLTFYDFNLIENNEFSLRKSGSWSSNLALGKTSFGLSLSESTIERIDSGATRNNQLASISATRTLSPRSNTSIKASLRRSEFGSTFYEVPEQLDYYRTYEAAYSRNFARRLNVVFKLRHFNRSSTNVLRNIDETRASINIRKHF